ncbi:MAG TPA: CapA family protein [Candidatus Woesebacteria bacterium]|nr:CapA family protein [Candidatus Woesebacteria bacterium]
MKNFRLVIAGIIICVVGSMALVKLLSFFISAPTTPTESSGISLEASLPTPTPTPQCATLLFGGDMMFDRHIREKAQAKGNYDFIFDSLAPLFSEADVIVANLEGPVTDFPSRSVGSEIGSTNNYFFTFEPKVVVEILAQWPFIVNLGNNHILNFGQEGLTQTYWYLKESGLPYFGYTQPAQEEPSYVIKEIRGISFGFVNYNQFVTGGKERVYRDMAEIRDSVEVLVVYTHWGNEYVQENQVIKDLAHQLVEAGADLIIGSHPHVVQGVEAYEGKRIYYSLGNFVFDQYFEEAVQNGLLVEAKVCQSTDTDSFNWEFIDHPIQLNLDGTTSLTVVE